MTFYKIVDGLPQVGSGTKAPEGFIEYEIGNEPTELQDALQLAADRETIQKQLSEAKKYLIDTDWVVAKIGEAQMRGEDITTLLTKYSVELSKRQQARAEINEVGE